jgi:hypothetical protein
VELRPKKVKVFASAVVVFFCALSAFGQTPDPRAAGTNPTITVVAGLGNAMSIFGADVEGYVRRGRVSVFGGLGYLPEFEPGDPSGVTGAAGARVFTSGRTHRAFLEVSVSPLLFEYFTVGTTRIPGSKVYGPGFQGGYQYVARSGLTGLASIGTGFPIGAETGDRVALMAGMGLGFTWRR